MFSIRTFSIRKNAFTLSEVLIALVVIGVVAAVTIPQIMLNIQNHQFKSALKKNYAVLSNAFNLTYGFDYEDFREWDYKTGTKATSDMLRKLSKYLYIQKNCDRNDGCFTREIKAKNGKKALWHDLYVNSSPETKFFVLNDGTSVCMAFSLGKNTIKYHGVLNNLISPDLSLALHVDVNGVKKPNTLGRDIFVFVLTSKGLVPAGIDNNSEYCDDLSVNYNYDCAAKVLKSK